MRTTTITRVVAGTAVVAFAASACGSKAKAASGTTGVSSAAAAALSTCMVTDTGGIDDKSFNASAWAGLEAAKADGKVTDSFLPSATENDYVTNINALLAKKCGLIITVGGLMGDATDAAAKANPNQRFAIVDDGATDGKSVAIPNLHGLEFNTAQGGFLAGYLAASVSKSGVVGTWGGLNIPPVTVYMDGFWEGVQYFNKAKGKSVTVLGWDETNQKGGTFSQTFQDANAGKQITDSMVNQKADVIFPVAGGAGAGAAASAKASGGKVSVIWVDTDGCVSDRVDCPVFLASVTKGITTLVKKVAEDAAGGTFSGGASTVTNLSNGGTDLVPGAQLGASVPASVTSELAAIKAQIIAGTITISSPSQPK